MRLTKKLFACLTLCLFTFSSITGCSSENTTPDATDSSIDNVLEDTNLSLAIIGTYIGVDGSVLTFLSDGTADYYFQPDGKNPIQGQSWSISDNRIIWKYDGKTDVYAEIINGDVSSLFFKSDNPYSWTDEQYTKVTNEAAHWTIAESDAFLGITTSDTADEEGKEPWDITGSWCEESVENGGAGMAAYVSDNRITIFHVSDNALIRTPFWICDYEQQQTDSFTLNTKNITEHRADCTLLSVDDEKELTFNNGTISFSSSQGDKELKRTQLDFSDDYHIIPTNASPTTVETGGLSITVPKTFGLYTSTKNDNNGDTIRFISSDAVLMIQSLQPADLDLNDFSEKDYNALIDSYTKTVVDGVKELFSDSTIEYDEDTTINEGPAHKFKITGLYDNRFDSFHYMDTFGNKKANYVFTVSLTVAGTTTHDYDPDFNDIIASIERTTTSSATNENGMPLMAGTSIDAATKKASTLGVEELYDEGFGHGTRCKSLSDSTGGLTIDIIYSSATKEILCASITTFNLVSSSEQKQFVKEIAGVLCPSTDSTEVSTWVQNNIGSSKSTSIDGFTYETALGPSSNILYYAGSAEWEEWELNQ